MTRSTTILTALLAATAVGCTEPGYGRFDGDIVGGPACLDEFLPFDSAFQTAQDRRSSIALFFQSDGGAPTEQDVLNFTFLGPESLTLGTPYTMAAPLEAGEEDAVGQLTLAVTCPESVIDMYLEGDVTLTQFSSENNSPVAGSVDGATIVAGETGEVLIENFNGDWEFPLQTGPPYEPFP